MKSSYENRTRISLVRRTYTVIRIDGKTFHSHTKGLLEIPVFTQNREFLQSLIPSNQ
jgi:tRNA(His) 5'-end guanylyltransferase